MAARAGLARAARIRNNLPFPLDGGTGPAGRATGVRAGERGRGEPTCSPGGRRDGAFTRFARIMGSQGARPVRRSRRAADPTRHQAPVHGREGRVREARATGLPLFPLVRRFPVLPGRTARAVGLSGVLYQPTSPGRRARGTYVAAMGRGPLPQPPLSFHANLASPGRKDLPGSVDDRGSSCEPVRGPHAYNVVLRVFVTRVLDRSRPPPHISCGWSDTPPPKTTLQHAFQWGFSTLQIVRQFLFPFTPLYKISNRKLAQKTVFFPDDGLFAGRRGLPLARLRRRASESR